MSRFHNLEFNDRQENREAAVVKDEAYYLREADAAFLQGEFAEALRAYSKVLEHNPQHAGAWTAQVRMLIELGEFREAALWADRALETFPREPELLAAKAVTLARLGDLDNALAFSDAAIETRGDTPYVWLARGDVLLARQEKRADYCMDKALAVAPRDWVFHWLAARIYFFYEKFALALKTIRQALTLDDGQCALWLQLGLCQQALGVAPGQSFEMAKQLNPRCIVPAVKRGFWRRLTGS